MPSPSETKFCRPLSKLRQRKTRAVTATFSLLSWLEPGPQVLRWQERLPFWYEKLCARNFAESIQLQPALCFSIWRRESLALLLNHFLKPHWSGLKPWGWKSGWGTGQTRLMKKGSLSLVSASLAKQLSGQPELPRPPPVSGLTRRRTAPAACEFSKTS